MTSSPSAYPERDQFFAHKFVRLLTKSCAAQDIGLNAFSLLCVIAHTEDAARYKGPVRYWNEQLQNTLSLSPKQLRAARDKAIEFGWLNYRRKDDRSVGHYFVTIPARAEGLDDSPIEDQSCPSPCPPEDIERDIEKDKERTSNGTRNGHRKGQPSNPVPFPVPDSFALSVPSNASEPHSPVIVEIPVVGKGPKLYGVTQDKIDEWAEVFPAVDIVAECRRAAQWSRDNPTKRKTFSGVPKFLNGWLSRKQNEAGNGNGRTKQATNRAAANEQANADAFAAFDSAAACGGR